MAPISEVGTTAVVLCAHCGIPQPGERFLELTLVARNGRLVDSGCSTTTFVAVSEPESLGGLLSRLMVFHGFSGTTTTLHVDPAPGVDPTRLHPSRSQSHRYRLQPDDEFGDATLKLDTVLPERATGYLCVGSGQWLWYVRALRAEHVMTEQVLRVVGPDTRRFLG
jgi:hypothetical protein